MEVALLIMLLSGCVATPSKYQERKGDFIMNIGSAAPVIVEPRAGQQVAPSLAAASAQSRG